ncbi:hypothetical protein KI387_009001, partial [Taxus chinensis]
IQFWDLEGSKIIRSRDIDWNEKRMYMDQVLVPKGELVENFVDENELSDLKLTPTGLHSNWIGLPLTDISFPYTSVGLQKIQTD